MPNQQVLSNINRIIQNNISLNENEKQLKRARSPQASIMVNTFEPEPRFEDLDTNRAHML